MIRRSPLHRHSKEHSNRLRHHCKHCLCSCSSSSRRKQQIVGHPCIRTVVPVVIIVAVPAAIPPAHVVVVVAPVIVVVCAIPVVVIHSVVKPNLLSRILLGSLPIVINCSLLWAIILFILPRVSCRKDSLTSDWTFVCLPLIMWFNLFRLKWFFTIEKQPSIGLYYGQLGTLMILLIFICAKLPSRSYDLWYEAPSMNKAKGFFYILTWTSSTYFSNL